jgi:methyl-accepting chemotaxis protein
MFNNLSIRARLILIISTLSILAVTLSGVGLFGIYSSNSQLQAIYNARLIPSQQLSEIRSNNFISRIKINAALVFEGDSQSLISDIQKSNEKSNEIWVTYLATKLTSNEKILADKFDADRQTYQNKVLTPAIELIKNGNHAELEKLIAENLRPLFKTIDEDINNLLAFQVTTSKTDYETAQSRYHTILMSSLVMLFLGLTGSIYVGLAVIRNLTNSLNNAQNVATAIAKGNLDSHIEIEGNDEITVLLKAMQAMQNIISAFVSAQNLMSSKHNDGWIYEKIDSSKFNGVYADMAAKVNEMVAGHVAVKMRVVEILNQYGKGDFSIDMQALPNEKAKVSTAVNTLKTKLLAINNEVETIAKLSALGDLSKRADAANFDFMFKSMLNHLNSLVETCDGAFGDVQRVSNALAEGDLTQTITKDYPGVFGRVKDGMNATTENLKTVMTEIKETTEIISSVAKEISSGNNDLSHRTEEQAASLEETAASMHELTSTVQHNTENAKQANELATGAAQTANKGVIVVQDVVSTMDNINESSLRIVDIISVIDDIAFQTNILALNAAVEAARAGEQGKGFAVVATEVRNLAQRAANAAGEIKRLINDSVERVSGGSRQVAEAGKTMQDIVDSIGKVTSIISEIASASEQQNSGIAQVGHAIGSMDEVTQQNAALVEEVAATAESLESQTSHLVKEMSHFKTGNEKGNAYSTSSVKSSHVSAVSAHTTVSAPNFVSPAKKVELSSVGTFSVGADDWEEF